MKPGDVVLVQLPQIAGGPLKLRPALILALLPGSFQNVLICGISTQLRDLQPDWDEQIGTGDADYPASGLHRASVVRLSYLYSAEKAEISGPIGRVGSQRLTRLRHRLMNVLT
jgi:mRNA interferase MazF